LEVAKHEDSRRCIVLLGAILETPSLVDRLMEVLKPEAVQDSQEERERLRKGKKAK
jgi:hypothetical protein